MMSEVRSPTVGMSPKVTPATPSFDQAPLLEATLTPVVRQGYPNLVDLVIYGGSTDGGVEILGRYEVPFSALVRSN